MILKFFSSSKKKQKKIMFVQQIEYKIHGYFKKHDSACCVILTVILVIVILTLLFLGSHTDHDHGCNYESRPDHIPYYRPIDSSIYGTPPEDPYSRGIKQFKNWKETPKPKFISDSICDESIDYSDLAPHDPVTNLYWVHGQFLVHTFALALNNDQEDRIFKDLPDFVGIHPSIETLDANGHRQQVNHVSPYMDMSVIYGSTEEVAHHLRANDGSGKLKMVSSPYHDGLLLKLDSETQQYKSGDIRVNENVLLAAYHTLWNREHNWWCDRLKHEHHDWSGDKIYHTARHIVAGELQAITYREWLPILIGTKDLFGRKACYDPKCYVTVRNEVATAFLRIGHTLVTDTIEARDIDHYFCPVIENRTLTLLEAFEQTSVGGSLWKYDIDTYILGGIKQQAEQLDPKVNNDLRGNIFDLAAMNLARGRNHELPSYQKMYEAVKKEPFSNINQLTDSFYVKQRLIHVYGKHEYYDQGYRDYHVNHHYQQEDGRCDYFEPIDLWIAAISEKKLPGALMGEIGARAIMEQFDNMRNCDPYFYLWDPVVEHYLDEIHNTRLSKIIIRNTKIPNSVVKPNAFKFY
jgi:hypothetical protein